MANSNKCNDQMPFSESFGKDILEKIWIKICKDEIPQIDIIMDLYDTVYHHSFYYTHKTWLENNLKNTSRSIANSHFYTDNSSFNDFFNKFVKFISIALIVHPENKKNALESAVIYEFIQANIDKIKLLIKDVITQIDSDILMNNNLSYLTNIIDKIIITDNLRKSNIINLVSESINESVYKNNLYWDGLSYLPKYIQILDNYINTYIVLIRHLFIQHEDIHCIVKSFTKTILKIAFKENISLMDPQINSMIQMDMYSHLSYLWDYLVQTDMTEIMIRVVNDYIHTSCVRGNIENFIGVGKKMNLLLNYTKTPLTLQKSYEVSLEKEVIATDDIYNKIITAISNMSVSNKNTNISHETDDLDFLIKLCYYVPDKELLSRMYHEYISRKLISSFILKTYIDLDFEMKFSIKFKSINSDSKAVSILIDFKRSQDISYPALDHKSLYLAHKFNIKILGSPQWNFDIFDINLPWKLSRSWKKIKYVYHKMNPNKVIKLFPTWSVVEMIYKKPIINGCDLLNIKVPLHIAVILFELDSKGIMSKPAIIQSTNIPENIFDDAIKTLERMDMIVNSPNGLMILYDNFDNIYGKQYNIFPWQIIKTKNQNAKEKVINKIHNKHIIQAYLVRYLKKVREIKKDDLVSHCKDDISKRFIVSWDDIESELIDLAKKDYLEIVDEKCVYFP